MICRLKKRPREPNRKAVDQRLSLVELPGIEPAALPGDIPSGLQVLAASVRFSPARYLRFCSHYPVAPIAGGFGPSMGP
jgi:hypothetical protein